MRWIKRLSRLSGWPLITALALCFIAGILFWGGFNWSMELTNTESFCISCHEMKNNVYQEYQQTEHYSNRTGVRATCPDCHVPKEWGHKVVRKVRATNELYHWMLGSIDTREKFQAKREELANHVWTSMRETDSRECRNCHSNDYMALEKQPLMAKKTHQMANDWGSTCIECHQGIAHTLPDSFNKNLQLDALHKKLEQQAVACQICHEDLPTPIATEAW